MHGHGWRVAAGMAPHCISTPSSCLLASVTKSCAASARQALPVAGRQAGYGPEVKWLKSRGAMYCAAGGRMYCANDTQQRPQILY